MSSADHADPPRADPQRASDDDATDEPASDEPGAAQDSLHAPIARQRPDPHALPARTSYAALRGKLFGLATPASTLGRYTLGLQLGVGGMGVVHEAFGPAGERVAIKTLRTFSAANLERLKREIRRVADLIHPNLVALHELGEDRGEWFIVMDLVPGRGFIDHLRGADEPTLRAALGQLVRGLHALHGAGLLHRDLKPGNVLVTPAGRVVILDFGLVRDADAAADEALAGTPMYMAPEQARGEPTTTASDWYSLGLMLFEALVGRPLAALPGLAEARHRGPPPPLADLAPAAPPALAALCRALLDPDPARRPDGPAVLAALGLDGDADDRHDPLDAVPLLGRDRELAALAAAADARAAGPVLARVHGPSGVGKSALVDAFLRTRGADVVVLRGRCYERESVPYKALDELVDALTRHLRTWPSGQLAAVLPADLAALTRVFPALARLTPHAGPRAPQGADPQETRRRAFHALKQLLAAVAARAPLILAIDDVQWGDLDSAHLVLELLAPPDAPACLLLACYRSEDLGASPFLAELARAAPAPDVAAPALPAAPHAAPAAPERPVQVHDIAVEPLPRAAAEALARALLTARDGAADPALAAAIADESGGSPLFVEALIRQRIAGDAAVVSLDQALLAALGRVGPLAQDLLQLAAVSGQPLARRLLRAAALTPEGQRDALQQLRARRLLRSRGAGDDEPVLLYHDRIREVVVGNLAPAVLRDLHRRLAAALEPEPEPDHERLAFHCHGAGDLPRAGHHAAAAAARAFAALAFERAATLFARALAWQPALALADTLALTLRRADALAHAGRCADAAWRYLEAANIAARADAGAPLPLELRRRAAEQYLVSGHLERGLAVLRPLARDLGLTYPETPERAVLHLLLGVLRIRLRGLAFAPRATAGPSAATLRLDTCWSAAKGLAFIDPLRAAGFAAENLRLCLRHGDPARVAQALAHYALLDINQGGPRQAVRGADQIARAHDLALRTGDARTIGATTIVAGVAALNSGRWRRALADVEAGVATLGDRCLGVTWERSIARAMGMHALTMLGDLAGLGQRAAVWQREADELGDRFARVVAGLYVGHARLAAGDLAAARRAVADARADWTRDGFTFQHWLALGLEVACDLYSRRPAAAWQRVARAWPTIERSNLLRMQLPRIDTLAMRAGAAIAAAPGSWDRRSLLRAAARDARTLGRERLAHAHAHAALIHAGVAALTGDRAGALRWLERAGHGFVASDMPVHAACVRRRRALLCGDTTAVAEAELRARGVADPPAFAVIHAA